MTTVSLPSLRRLAVAVLVLAMGWTLIVLRTNDTAGSAGSPGSVPVATCGKGSLPETGMQGRVSTADHDSGRAAKGFRCNTRPSGDSDFAERRNCHRHSRYRRHVHIERVQPQANQRRDRFGQRPHRRAVAAIC